VVLSQSTKTATLVSTSVVLLDMSALPVFVSIIGEQNRSLCACLRSCTHRTAPQRSARTDTAAPADEHPGPHRPFLWQCLARDIHATPQCHLVQRGTQPGGKRIYRAPSQRLHSLAWCGLQINLTCRRGVAGRAQAEKGRFAKQISPTSSLPIIPCVVCAAL
jgi:hypothetical protein